jgi:hypothetical protein
MSPRPRRTAPARTLLGLAGLLTLGGFVAAPARAAVDHCQKCHAEQDGKAGEAARKYAADIHARRGIPCSGCHGGDPNDPEPTGMDPGQGFRGVPARAEIVGLCVACHADAARMKRYNPRPYIFSVDEFRTSVHGRRQATDPKVATCISCHGVHDIRPHTDPASPVYAANVPATCAKCHNADYMKGYGIPTNQYSLYVRSVHGQALLEKGDLSAPACNDCHGNHGAAPPGVESISMVCATCHGREGELFAKSKMAEGMKHIPTARGCETCHGNHGVKHPTDAMLSTAAGVGACTGCHEPGSTADRATLFIASGLDTLKWKVAGAESLLAMAELKGMDASLGRERLRAARDQLIGLRAALHAFDGEQITSVLQTGFEHATAAREQGAGALRDWRVRRLGLAAALAVILVLIALLVGRIRALAVARSAPGPPGA